MTTSQWVSCVFAVPFIVLGLAVIVLEASASICELMDRLDEDGVAKHG